MWDNHLNLTNYTIPLPLASRKVLNEKKLILITLELSILTDGKRLGTCIHKECVCHEFSYVP